MIMKGQVPKVITQPDKRNQTQYAWMTTYSISSLESINLFYTTALTDVFIIFFYLDTRFFYYQLLYHMLL